MSLNQNPPNQNDVEEHDVTEIIERIESLEETRSEILKSIESLGSQLGDLAESIDTLAEKVSG